MSNLFRSSVIKGNRLTDFSNTSASVGKPIPFGYGTFPTDGNVVFAALPPKEHVTRKRQGKGGVKQETYTYTLSYAISFCRGPIFGYRWIKRNGKVVYTTDPNAPIEDREYAQKWLQKATLYYGSRTQLPDSTIEAVKGSGQVSAHRGLAYIVIEDDDVTDGGGAVPNYEACVIRGAARSYTTPPYPVHTQDRMSVSSSARGGGDAGWPIDHMDVAVTPLGGGFREVVQYYDMQPENMDAVLTPLGGTITDVMQYYDMQPESMEITGLAPLGGGYQLVVLTYENYAPESLDITSLTPLGGNIS